MGWLHEATGERLEAVLVEAHEAGRPAGIVIAQPYRCGGLMRKRAEPVGPDAVVEKGPSRL